MRVDITTFKAAVIIKESPIHRTISFTKCKIYRERSTTNKCNTLASLKVKRKRDIITDLLFRYVVH